MKYERITNKKGWHEDIDLKEEYGYKWIYQRLAELEDKIENGTIIELPCKVGDTVYYETFAKNGTRNKGIQGHKVSGVRVLVVTENNYSNYWTEIPLSCFGKSVFFNKAEAEAKLKEKGEV